MFKKLIRSFDSEFMKHYKEWQPYFKNYDSFDTFCRFYDEQKQNLRSISSLDELHKKHLFKSVKASGVCTGIGVFFEFLQKDPDCYIRRENEEIRVKTIRDRIKEKYGEQIRPVMGMTLEEAESFPRNYSDIQKQTITDENGEWVIWYCSMFSHGRLNLKREIQFLNGIIIRIIEHS